MEEKVTMELNRSFSNHWFMIRLNLNLDNERNCEETPMFVKKCKKMCNIRRKESPICRINKDFYLKNQRI